MSMTSITLMRVDFDHPILTCCNGNKCWSRIVDGRDGNPLGREKVESRLCCKKRLFVLFAAQMWMLEGEIEEPNSPHVPQRFGTQLWHSALAALAQGRS